MTPPTSYFIRPVDEQRSNGVNLAMGKVLRAGVAACQPFILIGTMLTLLDHPHTGRALVVMGLLLLMATPVLCVVISVRAFIRQQDRMFAAVASGVLAVLLASFVLGMARR